MQAMDPRQLDNIFKALPLDMIRHEILPRLEPEDIIRFFLASREHLTWIPDLGFDCLVELLKKKKPGPSPSTPRSASPSSWTRAKRRI